MTDKTSILYQQSLPEELYFLLEKSLSGKQVTVFFRADDIGLVDEEFTRMMELFRRYSVPLCLAAVPKWITLERWQAMARFSPEKDLWCWHQHGYGHVNHEHVEKKNEFGAARLKDEIRRDLQAGRERLVEIMGNTCCPVFTPPWNRCSHTTLQMLSGLGFAAVSRSIGGEPKADLPDLYVNVDLHTGKETVLSLAMEHLLRDWRQGIESGRLGIMLHHLWMNNRSFIFLERLLQILRSQKGVTFCSFRELLELRG